MPEQLLSTQFYRPRQFSKLMIFRRQRYQLTAALFESKVAPNPASSEVLSLK
ncbi:hypothetical protein L917_18425 [Phytophthora nicotianae]|uniref:Uncharacterized protein n=1 Tax=Phytophthora nicotianae TaxID=4792 RepID=W2KA17_PHYNI|nr:hypothetical protein L917_18425 [Phytophthora nicotianae]